VNEKISTDGPFSNPFLNSIPPFSSEGVQGVDCPFIKNPVLRDICFFWSPECIFEQEYRSNPGNDEKENSKCQKKDPGDNAPSPAKMIMMSEPTTSIPPMMKS
jgi:hypothetical protein